jgi:hypothetical protein
LAKWSAKQNWKEGDAVNDEIMRKAIWESFHLATTPNLATLPLHHRELLR